MERRIKACAMLALAVLVFQTNNAFGQGKRGNGGSRAGNYYNGSGSQFGVQLQGNGGSSFSYVYRDGGNKNYNHGSNFGVGVYVPIGPFDLGYGYNTGYGSYYAARARFYNNDERYYYSEGQYYDGPRYVVPSDGGIISSVPSASPTRELPPLPTAEDATLMSEDQIRQVLLVGVKRFQGEMEQVENGNTSIEYFSLVELRRQLEAEKPDTEAKTPPVDSWKETVARLASAAQSSQYDVVSRRWGFQVMLLLLPEYAKPAHVRRWSQLQYSVREFTSTLRAADQGPGWLAYLRVEDLQAITAGDESAAAANDSKLRETLKLFDDVAKNPQYQAVVRLTGFVPVHVGLQRYLAAAGPVTEALPPAPPAVGSP